MTSNTFFEDLRARMEAGLMPSDSLELLKASRTARRGIFASENGMKELARLIVYSGVLSKVDAGDPVSIGAHNMMVDMLDDMGLLDEANMESLVGFMLGTPVIPAERAGS